MRTTDEFLSQWMGVFDGKQNPLSGNLESFPLFLLLQYPGEVMRFKLYLRLERGRKVKQSAPVQRGLTLLITDAPGSGVSLSRASVALPVCDFLAASLVSSKSHPSLLMQKNSPRLLCLRQSMLF